MSPDEVNDTNEEKLEELPRRGVDDTYPSTDDGQDSTELYQEGLTLDEPNAGNTVEGYDPSQDQRLKRK
jgi:hypothetical protein